MPSPVLTPTQLIEIACDLGTPVYIYHAERITHQYMGTHALMPLFGALQRLARMWPRLALRRPGTTMLVAGASAPPAVAAQSAAFRGTNIDHVSVLVLDDLQWADKASLLLLAHLTATDQPMRVTVLGTYRDNELSPTQDRKSVV